MNRIRKNKKYVKMGEKNLNKSSWRRYKTKGGPVGQSAELDQKSSARSRNNRIGRRLSAFGGSIRLTTTTTTTIRCDFVSIQLTLLEQKRNERER